MKTMYHLSKTYLGDKVTLTPKVPDSACFEDEGDIPRICFSTNVFYCVRGIIGCKRIRILGLVEFKNKIISQLDNEEEEELKLVNPSIYVTTKKLYIPPTCGDFRYNKEYWALENTEVKFIGYLCLKKLISSELKITDNINTLDPSEWWQNKSEYILLPKVMKLN